MKTVGDLIAALQEFDPNTPVLLASDEEGNSFDPWWSATDGDLFVVDDYGIEAVPSDVEVTHLDNLIEAVVLWP